MSTENTEGSSVEMKTVLCVFKERRRPVTFRTSNDAQVERKHLLDAVRASFADVLSTGEGTSASRSYFLQTESTEWGGMVDVTGCVEDRATVHLCYDSTEPGVPAEEQQIEQRSMRRRNVLPPHISSRERNAQRDAPVLVQERERTIPVLNAPERRVAPAGNGPGHQPHRTCYSSCSWKICMIISLVIMAILACQRMYMGHPVISTPLNAPKAVVSSWDNDKQLWGSYRAGVYFGMRPRIPRSLLSGMMWYVYGRSSVIRHTCENHQLPKFGWLRHDGVSCGEQEIIDNGTALKTEFVTTPRGWTARITADTRDSSPVLVSFFFYVYNEGSGTMAFKNSEEIIYGETPELKKFQMTFDERSVSNDAVYNHAAAKVWSVNQFASYVKRISERKVPKGREKWPAILQLPGDIKDPNEPEFKPNVAIYEVTTPLPYEVDLIFEFGGLHGNGVDNFSHMFNARMGQFDQKFKKVFQLKSKGYNESEVSFAKAALSNLLGSISYFFGESKVTSKDSPDVELNYWPASLYTAIPSRTIFPRGFLWNEGFHQLLVAHWDTSIVKDVIAHWLDLMNEEGWIPREQILGAEAESKVPTEFIVQRNDHANPPTFFLTLETLIEIEKRPDFVFLRRIFPRLKKWFEWYSTTQAGEMQYTYRWRGRNGTTQSELIPVTMASGLNDFPRASHPTFQEYHVDLRCWMTLASGVMAKIGQLLGEDSQFYSVRYKVLSDQNLLDTLHWNSTAQTYSDYGLHTSDVILYKLNVDDKKDSSEKRYERSLPSLRFVDSFGYVNLFPFFFKLVSPTSEHLVFILNKLADKNILWTDYGLRSLSKQDAFYDRHNTKDDPPYWRGAIWINMNYLACRALHHYGNVKGPYRQKAEKLYKRLRSNLIRNMYREYNERGYIWEHYSDKTGRGQGTHPFTGWSSLIVLIMAEKY